ncbi:MAG: sensor histidine kinase, partial [Planctomycetaceae bacterium]
VQPDRPQAPQRGESDAAAANPPADLPVQTDLPTKGGYEENVLTQQFITRNQMQQTARSLNEYQRRSMTAEQNFAYGLKGLIIENGDAAAVTEQVEQGVMQAVWIDEALILARRTVIDDHQYLQGCVLEWRAIADALTAEVRDLLPQARLLPARDAAAAAPLRLASLPLMLAPGRAPHTPIPLVTPLRLSLLLAWIGLAVAALAVAALLMAAMRLSDRRGDFVSAVTHELRTPLTTFRMYTEMLAEGMVQDEQKRAGYLQTLRVEADRLGHLVENVLSYARLERNTVRAEQEEIALDDLLARVEDPLRQRAERAGMSLCIERPDESIVLRADRAAVERILFNLIDNACKYAADAEDRRIHLAVARDGRRVAFRVRDHGRGISRREARRLFRPFSKSAQQAAHSAPGIGLGLALCRRLARSMHGDLRIDHAVTDGACFTLTLPAA